MSSSEASGPGAGGDGRSEKARAEADMRDHAYKLALAAALLLLATATIVYHQFEDWSWVDSFYFSAIAASTVGFGDFSPTTDFTKLFTVGYVFAGVSLLGVVLNEALRRHAQRVAQRRSGDTDD
jgi:hypothetical protein